MYIIDKQHLNIDIFKCYLSDKDKISLSVESINLIESSCNYLQNKVLNSDSCFYGINTGFGFLCDIKIDTQSLEELQVNLVMSHAFGVGDLVPEDIIKIMLFLKIINLSQGYSGVKRETIEKLIELYNRKIYPLIFQQGSLGASGDLAPLAHLSLPLLGMGKVYYEGKVYETADLFQKLELKPIKLGMKEGLALLNGTQFSLSYGIYSLVKSKKLSMWADIIASISLDAFGSVLSPFDSRIHEIRPHQGQVKTAENIRRFLKGSAHMQIEKNVVQDPYSFRCIPQVHGATKDTIAYVESVLERELNSTTDNPNIFADSDAILSGGNFHAQPIALVLDFLAIAVAELANISERRIYQLISGQRGLPPFLTSQSGLHSGLMIGQYTAASIVSQNKQYCTPASVDSIVSSNGQEDHVSMAANAGTKLIKVVENVEKVLAIELINASQAMGFRSAATSVVLEQLLSDFRKEIPRFEKDRIFSGDLEKAILFLRNYSLEGWT